jgi:hypothetical protein
MPFASMSGDPEQEYFADGMVEEIITALSKVRWFDVIARNSSFIYKGRAVDVKQVGRELGVRYVLEGSVRNAANRIRVTAQLVEAETGKHVWAERYDRELANRGKTLPARGTGEETQAGDGRIDLLPRERGHTGDRAWRAERLRRPAATYECASDTSHSPAAAAMAATESAVARVAGEFLPRYATARRRI